MFSVKYGPPDPGPRHNVPPLGYSKLLTSHICLFFPHLVKFLANTMQFNTTCKAYDSINQHSHQSTRTTGPQALRSANHDHAEGGGGGATLEHIYICICISWACLCCATVRLWLTIMRLLMLMLMMLLWM